MKISRSLTVGITALVLMLWVGPIWAQTPPGNDISDGLGNTGGGDSALIIATESGAGLNTAYGFDAGFLITSSENTAFGFKALRRSDDPNASRNTAVGAFGLLFNTGANNTASGYAALARNRGNSNTAFGDRALASGVTDDFLQDDPNPTVVRPPTVTGSGNTAIGSIALFNNLSGSQNTAIGSLALLGSLFGSAQNTGSSNTAIGFGALRETQTATTTPPSEKTRSPGTGTAPAISQSARKPDTRWNKETTTFTSATKSVPPPLAKIE